MKVLVRKSLYLIAFALFGLSACAGDNETRAENQPEKTNIPKKLKRGDVQDAHGCLTSEGYVWSAAKDSCIHLWESGAELTATNKSEHIVFAVISDDKMKAEIFVPDDTSYLLTSKGGGTYANDSLQLTASGNNFTLKKNGQIIYQTAVPVPVQEVKQPAKRKGRKR